MIKELQDFGLSEKEARVYYAALEIGKATADRLAKHAKVNRSTTYVQIESLKKKGLISEYVEDKKTFFVAESPKNLSRLLERQKEEIDFLNKKLKKILPEFQDIYEGGGKRPAVRFFQGKEGIATLREEALEMTGKDLFIIYSYAKFREVFSKEELDLFSSRRISKKIKSHIIYTHVDEPEPDFKPLPLTEVQFLDSKLLALSSDILIYDSKVCFIVLERTPGGIVIESEEITKTMKSIFDYLWALGQIKIIKNI